MRTTPWMRAHSIARKGVLPALLCAGAWLFLAWSGCAGGSPPEEHAPPTDITDIADVEEAVPAEESMAAPAEAFSPPDSAASGSVAGKIRDASLVAKVQLALAGTHSLRAHRFDPEAAGGHVILRGHVETWAQREQAAAVAAGVSGVASVANELTSTEKRPAGLADASERSGNASDASPADGAAGALERDALPGLPGGGTEEPTYHTVARGESLWTISRKYDVRMDEIKALNRLSSDEINVGQRLRIR